MIIHVKIENKILANYIKQIIKKILLFSSSFIPWEDGLILETYDTIYMCIYKVCPENIHSCAMKETFMEEGTRYKKHCT